MLDLKLSFTAIITALTLTVPVSVLAQDKNLLVIETTEGTIKLSLSDLTPAHKKRIITLANSGYYDKTTFHRTIPQFMIQGGSPDTKDPAFNGTPGARDTNWLLPPEFRPELFHRRGALAVARTDNPEKLGGCQFYIVQGKKSSLPSLQDLEKNLSAQKMRDPGVTGQFLKFFFDKPENAALKAEYDKLSNPKLTQEERNTIVAKIGPALDAAYKQWFVPFKFSQAQLDTYSTEGGAPHLDGNYTVIGQVVSGMEVVDKIAAKPLKNPQAGEPENPVRMTKVRYYDASGKIPR